MKTTFAESTPQWYSSGSPPLLNAQATICLEFVNGKGLISVASSSIKEAIERARVVGDGPTLIEAIITYRNHGHF